MYIFYHIAHVGDTFHSQKVIENIIKSNPDKEIMFYLPYNHFIYNDISNNILIKNENNAELITLLEQLHAQPYGIIHQINKDITVFEVSVNKLTNHDFHILEMDPVSYQDGIIKLLNDANLANPNFGFKYNVLSPADLVPKIPNTDINLFLEWRKYNPQPLILYYNNFPKAGQTPICINEEQHNLVILQILLTNPNFTILLPKCPEALKGIPRIVGCDLAFNCIETPSCENLYKINKIQIHCDYSVHFDIGGTELYMNTDFFTRKNHILHFNKYGPGYNEILTNFLKKVGPVNRTQAITCRNHEEMITFFNKNPLQVAVERKQGYGLSFNNIFVAGNTLIKQAKNQYGVSKIKKEILFYNYALGHKCLPMPEFICSDETSYTMKYLDGYKPLFEVFPTFSLERKKNILERIHTHLQCLHNIESKIVTKEVYTSLLRTEMIDKLEERYDEVKDILKEFSHIKTVNKIPISSFDKCIQLLKKKMENFIESKIYYFLNPIHGDCQFNNILCDKNDDLIFIDPRGYYGNSDLFGAAEYDLAKVKFALSGYGEFDSKEVVSLSIEQSNITIDISQLMPDCLAKDDFLTQLVVSIWMGNAHCFKENKFKTAYSYFIAMYYASLYL
jgi:hypothetical protein